MMDMNTDQKTLMVPAFWKLKLIAITFFRLSFVFSWTQVYIFRLFKLYNSNFNPIEFLALNFNQILTSRQTTFIVLEEYTARGTRSGIGWRSRQGVRQSKLCYPKN